MKFTLIRGRQKRVDLLIPHPQISPSSTSRVFSQPINKRIQFILGVKCSYNAKKQGFKYMAYQ